MSENLTPAKDAIPVDDRDELQEMRNFPYKDVQMLLNIIEKQASVAPKATHLSSVAHAVINDLNDKARDIARRRNDKIVAADAKRAEAERNRLQRINDDQQASAERGRPVLQAKIEPLVPGQPMPDRNIPVAEEDIDGSDSNEVGPLGAPTLAERRI